MIAGSVDEAKQKGFEQARQKWPLDGGWMEHRVEAEEAEQEILSQAALIMSQE